MKRVVKGMKTLPWVAVGLVLLLGPLQLGVAVEVNPPSATVNPPNATRNPPKLEVRETPTELRIELPGDVLFDFDKGDIHGSEGFLVIQSTESLDVTAVYTAGQSSGGEVQSIAVEQIRERRLHNND